jgi:hypothetical protein
VTTKKGQQRKPRAADEPAPVRVTSNNDDFIADRSQPRAEPVVELDGWTTVAKKGKRR